MSARRVASLAVASASFEGTAVLPEATPTTLPTAVTAVAEATANPRTEIRLTRFPSSIDRLGDPRGRNRAPRRWPPNCGVTGGAGPVGNSLAGIATWCAGGIRRLYGVLRFLWCRTAGGTGVSYAGPDRSETLPYLDATGQFRVACESSHLVCPRSFAETSAQQDAARL